MDVGASAGYFGVARLCATPGALGIDQGHLPRSEFSRTTIRRIELDATFDQPSKLDRGGRTSCNPMDRGEATAEPFLDNR